MNIWHLITRIQKHEMFLNIFYHSDRCLKRILNLTSYDVNRNIYMFLKRHKKSP